MIDVVDTEGKGFSWTVFTAHAAPPPKRPGMPVFFYTAVKVDDG